MHESTSDSSNGHSLAALVLRLAVGPTMFAHGYNKAFGAGGIQGTERWFGGIGFSPANVHARMAAATEMTSGALITLGAANPLPSAAVIGVMAVAARSDHRDKGFFVFKGGWEYVAVLSAAAAALAAMGNGKVSVDHLLGNRRRGLKAMALAAGLGLANGALVLKATFHPEPPAEKAPAAAAPAPASEPEPEPSEPEPSSSNGSTASSGVANAEGGSPSGTSSEQAASTD